LIDTTLPVTPTATPLSTNDTTPVITGTANPGPGEILTVTVDGVTYTAGDGNLIDNGDGTWNLSLPSPLAEGIYDVIATITDAAGNSSLDTGVGELTIDTTPSQTPTVESLVTENSTPTLTGTALTDPGDILSVIVDGVTYTAGDGNLVDNGDGTWSLVMPYELTESTFTIQASITDMAGNTSISEAATLVVLPSMIAADFDNDGVPDNIDLDDDNDGIPRRASEIQMAMANRIIRIWIATMTALPTSSRLTVKILTMTSG